MSQEPTLKEIVARNHREQMFVQGAVAGASISMQLRQLAQGEAQIAQNEVILQEVAEQGDRNGEPL